MATLKANGKCIAEIVVRCESPKEEMGSPIRETTYRYMTSQKILMKCACSGGRFTHKFPYSVYGKLPKGTTGERFIEIMKGIIGNRKSEYPENKYEIIKEEVY